MAKKTFPHLLPATASPVTWDIEACVNAVQEAVGTKEQIMRHLAEQISQDRPPAVRKLVATAHHKQEDTGMSQDLIAVQTMPEKKS